MLTPMTNYIVSLAYPVQLLKEVFREELTMMIQRNHRQVSLMTGSLNYNAVPYMRQLLIEIFNQGPDPDMSQVAESTKLLAKDGLSQETAFTTAHQAFQATVDALSCMIPGLTFGNLQNYGVDMISEFDAMVTPPWGHQLENKEDDHNWEDEMSSQSN